MSIYKKVLLALASFAVISTANAHTEKVGTVDYSGTLSTGIVFPDNGQLFDEFYFAIAEGNGLQIGMTSFFWGDTAADAPEIRFILSGGAGPEIYTPLVWADPDYSLFSAGMTLTGLTAGEGYTLQIEGSDIENLGWTYSLQLAAVNIPEPESGALMLTALGLMGLLGRRQNKNVKEII